MAMIFNYDLLIGIPATLRLEPPRRLDVAEAILLRRLLLLNLDVVHVVGHGNADGDQSFSLDVDLTVPAMSAAATARRLRRLGTSRGTLRRALGGSSRCDRWFWVYIYGDDLDLCVLLWLRWRRWWDVGRRRRWRRRKRLIVYRRRRRWCRCRRR